MAGSESLDDVLPEGDYRFHLTLRRSEPRAFFRVPPGSAAVLAERARWIDADAPTYARLTPAGAPLLAEFSRIAGGWGAAPFSDVAGLARAFDCDVLLLSREPDGQFRLAGGALCFATGWSLAEKLGHEMDIVHAAVPGLNAALGASIQQFLARLKPGVAFLRDNWGIAASAELNLHPARGIPPPGPPVDLRNLWLRVEHQALAALPETRGIVFGIRIALHPLATLAGTSTGARLRHALATMPSELAAYKRLDRIRSELLGRL